MTQTAPGRPAEGPTAARLAALIADPSARGIASAMTDLIRGGDLAPGSSLPTVRALAAELGVSPERSPTPGPSCANTG
ncbi:GntR family transcriptional regulator [Streptomyces sp. M19]